MTTTLRTHLKREHFDVYQAVTSSLGLKHSDKHGNSDLGATQPDAPEGPFELDKWIKLLIKWIVSDDQVCIDVIIMDLFICSLHLNVASSGHQCC